MCFKIVVCMYFSDGRAERPYFYAVSRKQVAHIKNFVVGEQGERFAVNTAELNIGNIQLFQPLELFFEIRVDFIRKSGKDEVCHSKQSSTVTILPSSKYPV